MATVANARGGWRRSIWIVWVFLSLAWIAFLYIGIRTGRGRWILWGLIYFVLFVVLTAWNNAPLLAELIYWLVPIIHAFRIRKEYLARLDAGQQHKPDYATYMRENPLNRETSRSAQPTQESGSVQQQSFSIPKPAATHHASLVDLNDSSERELATLPGVGVIVAKRAVSLRESQGDFRSVEDFGEALGLKSHIVERIRPMATVSPSRESNQSSETVTRGRVVDF